VEGADGPFPSRFFPFVGISSAKLAVCAPKIFLLTALILAVLPASPTDPKNADH